MRKVLLEIFKKTYIDNDLEYNSTLKVVFKDRVPKSFKNTPTFSKLDNLEELSKVHFLNEEGINVLFSNFI